MARRSFLTLRGLWRIVVWGALVGGGLLTACGWGIDALVGQSTAGWQSYAMTVFGAYALSVFLCILYHRGLSMNRKAFSFRTALGSDYAILLGHGLTLVAVIMAGMQWTHFLACELVWLFIWVVRAHAFVRFSKKPFVFDGLSLGEWKTCDEVPMLIDLVASPRWKTFSMAQRKELWDALPDWKWTLHVATICTETQRHLREWMEVEDHPYWRVARGMHQDDLAESIRVFLAARDGGHGEESYEFVFD